MFCGYYYLLFNCCLDSWLLPDLQRVSLRTWFPSASWHCRILVKLKSPLRLQGSQVSQSKINSLALWTSNIAFHRNLRTSIKKYNLVHILVCFCSFKAQQCLKTFSTTRKPPFLTKFGLLVHIHITSLLSLYFSEILTMYTLKSQLTYTISVLAL